MENKYFKKIIFIAFAWLGFSIPYFASAQSLSLISDRLTYGSDDQVSVSLILNTAGNDINSIGGTIKFSTEYFDLSQISAGKSIFTLWPERPESRKAGEITFTGGVPGGFDSQKGNIFNFVLKVKKTGKANVSIENAKVLLNDGRGTMLENVEFNPLTIEIGTQKIENPSRPEPDKIQPEPFSVILNRDKKVAENKYFASFAAVDKQSGIDYYLVKENYTLFPYFLAFYSAGWQKAETPYVLTLQHWWSKVSVRAYDKAGNYRQASANKPMDSIGVIMFSGLYTAVGAALIIIFVAVASFLIFKHFFNAKKRNTPRGTSKK